LTKKIMHKTNGVSWDISGKGYHSQQNRAYFKDSKICTIPHSRPGDKLNIVLDYDKNQFRRMHPIEAERCQNLPDNYTNVNNLSDTKRLELIGDGWTVDVITHVLSKMKF